MVAWGFDGAHGTAIRPPHVPATMPWAKDESVPGGNDGTRLTAALVNRLIGNIRALALAADVTLTEDSDADLTTAISALIGLVAPAAHEHDDRYYLESEVDALLAGLQAIAQKGLAGGYAGLDGSGKVPTAQLPDAVLGALSFQGIWDASTNSPSLASGAGTKGHYYIVTANGTTALDGISDWKVGDWAVYDGTTWRKIDNTDAVNAVAGLTGNISAASLKTALAIAVADITDASANGRSLISAADYTAMRTLLAVVATAYIVNNLTTNDATKPLSAAQGKSLKDQINALIAGSALPRGHLWGLALSNNATDATNDIDIAAGSCRSDDDTENIVIAAPITKRLDAAWAVGSAQGGRDTGSIANGTWHIWAIKRTDTGVVDVLFSTSATAPTMPTNYTKKRRIGSVIRVSDALLAFVQNGDEFLLKSTINDVATTALGTTPTNYVLTVPLGISVEAIFTAAAIKASTGISMFAYSPLADDQTADYLAGRSNLTSIHANNNSANSGSHRIRTNASGEIRAVSSAAASTLYVATRGWVDQRGRQF